MAINKKSLVDDYKGGVCLLLEIPEAQVLAYQLNETIKGKRIEEVIANHTPHKFAWFYGDPDNYKRMLSNKIVTSAKAYGGQVEISVEDLILLFADGVQMRFLENKKDSPAKHQLLLIFADNSALSCSVQMYGGLWCFPEGQFHSIYYQMAKEKPTPPSSQFDENYFSRIISQPAVQNLSLKAFLATEQRIPGLGNGVLQDILFNAGLHPRKKVESLSAKEKEQIFQSIRSTLLEMVENGGRDTEKDLWGKPGGYKTIMSKNTFKSPCPSCGMGIERSRYMGGSIYFCCNCQKL